MNLINRVLEVDMDELRSPSLCIRIVKKTPHRTEEVPSEIDHMADLKMLTEALLCCILLAESNRVCKKGEAMERSMKYLQESYVDSSLVATVNAYDEQGNILKPKKQS